MNVFSKKTMIFRTMLLERVDSFKWMFCQRMFSQWWFSGDQSWSSCNLCQVWRFSEIRLRSAFLLQLPQTEERHPRFRRSQLAYRL